MVTFRSPLRTAALGLFVIVTFLRWVPAINAADRVLQGESTIDIGVRVPSGATRPGDGSQMLVVDDWTEDTVVGTMVLSGAKGAVVRLPNGRLQYANAADLTRTDRPFLPADKKKLGKLLVKRFFPNSKIKASRHYLYIYNTTEEFQQGTQIILESMLAGVVARFKKLGFKVHEPEVPLVVIMFRTEAEYRKHFNPSTGWVAFYSHNVNFIAMFQHRSKAVELRANARKRSISTIAHEGAHQLLANIGVQKRMSRWPLWTSEGLADYFAPTEVGRKFKWAGPGKVQEGRLYSLVDQLKERQAMPVDGSRVSSLVSATELDSSGYAAAWGFTFFLANRHPKEFVSYLHDMSSIGANQGVPRGATAPVASNLAVFQKHFGDDLKVIERDWYRYIALLHKEYETQRIYFVSFMRTVSGRQVQRRTAISTSAEAANSTAETWLQQ